MYFFITSLIVFLLVPTASSLPSDLYSRQEDTSCPENWQFDLASFSGPGCPDASPSYNRTGHYRTSPDWGSHYVPGCALQWAWFSFPWLQGSISNGEVYLGGEKRDSTWCELKIKYQEMRGTFAPYPVKKGEEKFKLVVHANGTTVEAKYGLDEGVSALWKFTYLPIGLEQIVDEIAVKGPVWNETKPATRLDWSTVEATTPQWTEPQCGPVVISMRIDLELEFAHLGAKGIIESKRSPFSSDWLGPTIGISHSWEPCVR